MSVDPNQVKAAVEQAASQAASDKWEKIKSWLGRYWYQFAIGFMCGWLFHRFVF